MFSISNILKGDSANKKYFLEQEGTTVFLNHILAENDMDLIQICISSIRDVASHSHTLRGMIRKDGNEDLSPAHQGSILGQAL